MLTEQSHGLGFRLWAAASKVLVKGLTDSNQGFGFRVLGGGTGVESYGVDLAEPGFRVQGFDCGVVVQV